MRSRDGLSASRVERGHIRPGTVYGSEGRRFKSSRARHFSRRSLTPLAGWVVLATSVAAHGADPTRISAHRAATHPMRYHVALPHGWSAERAWPVLVAIPDAGREFEANLAQFVAVRGDRPYVLVAPEVLSCGGARSRTRDHYTYTAAEWDSLQGGDDFTFED